MKILFFVYPSAFQDPGGGETMLLKTKEALEKKGVTVKLFNQWEDKLKDFDILHVFGSVKECLGLMRVAKSKGIKVVLSPIYWSTLQRALHEHGSIYSKAVMALRHITKLVFPVMPSGRRSMLVAADVIAPNSAAEATQVAKLFFLDRKKMHIVPLGADERFLIAEKSEFVKKFTVDNFILSVGRIEPRKNQLNLIRALKGSGLRLVFIGKPVSGYADYYQKCRQQADKDTLFIDRIDHESGLLASAYAACRAFVLQGWFETPGLVALEAGLAGARLVVTSGGSTREYFQDFVEYFNPASPASIRKAVLRAAEKEKSAKLQEHIKNKFLWSNAADENIRMYGELLK